MAKKVFLDKVEIGTTDYLDTPAHICIKNKSMECLEALIETGC